MKAATTEDAPPDLAQLQAVAAAGDAAVGDLATLPGAEPVNPNAERERDQAELAAMLTLAVKVGGSVEPALPKYYTPEGCNEIASAYLDCAEKYGWTWHKQAGGPEVRLGAAVLIPALLVFKERRERQAAQAEAAQKQLDAGTAPAPAGVVAPEHA